MFGDNYFVDEWHGVVDPNPFGQPDWTMAEEAERISLEACAEEDSLGGEVLDHGA